MTIYFATDTKRIKIGYTAGPVQRRIDQIAKHLPNKLELIGHIPGSPKVERAIHHHLREHALGAEWFVDCDSVRKSVRNFILAAPVVAVEPGRKRIPYKPKPKTPQEYGEMIARLADLLWPHRAAERFADYAGVSIEQVLWWFEGRAIPPALVRKSFASDVILYAMGGRHPDTL